MKELTVDHILTFVKQELGRKPLQADRMVQAGVEAHGVLRMMARSARVKHRLLKGLLCRAKEFHLVPQPVRSHGQWWPFVFELSVVFFFLVV